MCWIDSSYSATTITPFENGVVTLAELNFTGHVTIIGDTDGSSILLSGVMSEWNDDIDGLFVKEAMLLCSPSLPGCGAWIRGCYGHPIAEATSGWESPRVASVALPEGARFDRVVLQEEISKGQRVWTYVTTLCTPSHYLYILLITYLDGFGWLMRTLMAVFRLYQRGGDWGGYSISALLVRWQATSTHLCLHLCRCALHCLGIRLRYS